MLEKSIINDVIDSQLRFLDQRQAGIARSLDAEIEQLKTHALIISGIRRCGKSTFLHQLINKNEESSLYLNFDDPRLFGFNLNDFNRLDQIINERNYRYLYLDEIQLVEEWERFIRMLVDQQVYYITLTGSNAGMLSRELGTHLTGRHISKEMFPFSFDEFRKITWLESNLESSSEYLQKGGFPEYIKTENPDILANVLKDILYRDISVRYGVRNHHAIEYLAIQLLSNVGKPVSANSLKKLVNVGAASTILEYMHFFEQTYLFFFLKKFSYSYKKQIQNPRKVYAIDTGLIRINSISFSEDSGRLLENMVFLSLRRKTNELFYYSEDSECDFVVCKSGKPVRLIQVCYKLNQDNLKRELDGLLGAMRSFNIKHGEIVTMDQDDKFQVEGLIINAIPFHEFI